MRYSSNKPAKFKQPVNPKRSNEEFFRAAWPELTGDAPACALLLVGVHPSRGGVSGGSAASR